MLLLMSVLVAQAAPPIREAGSFGIGGGFGTTITGFDAKYWISDELAVQGIAGIGYYGLGDEFFSISLGVDVDFLFEFPEFVSAGDFKMGWHAGFGGIINGRRLGANGVVGIEFIFDGVPLDVVIDARPSLGFYTNGDGGAGIWGDPINTGAHVRYYF